MLQRFVHFRFAVGVQVPSVVSSCVLFCWLFRMFLSFCLNCTFHDPCNTSICVLCTYKCDRILENSSKSQMKYAVFLHVFNFISVNVYVFLEYFLNNLGISASNFTQYQEIS